MTAGDDQDPGQKLTRSPLLPFLFALIGAYAADHGVREQRAEDPIARRVACWTAVGALGTWAGAFLAFVAAMIFLGQLIEMQRTRADDEKHFRLDQRPVLASWEPGSNENSRAKNGIVYKEDQKALGWNYWVQNYGKTTAFNIRTSGCIQLFSDPCVEDTRTSADLGPNQHFLGTIFYQQPLQRERLELAERTTGGFKLKIVVRYDDLYGAEYIFPTCLTNYDNGSLGECKIPRDPKDKAHE